MATSRQLEEPSNPSPVTAEAIDKAVFNAEARINARLNGMEKAVEVYHSDLTRVPTTVDRSILGLRELLETRLLCLENDVKAVHDYRDTRGRDISAEIMHLRELSFGKIDMVTEKVNRLDEVADEKFSGIDKQFIERDKRTDQLSLADKTAVAAALQAAKEAVGAQNTSNGAAIAKSESSTIESIKQLQALFNTANGAMNDKINDVKSRLDKGEGRTSGVTESDVARARNSGLIFGFVGMGVAVATLALLAFRVVT